MPRLFPLGIPLNSLYDMISKKHILLGSLIVGKALFGLAQDSRPNIVFILTDDENVNTIGCYGNNVNTPNIDRLAEHGIRFTNANVVHTVCSPSRYAILTGRYYENNYHKDFLKDYPKGKAACVGNSISLEDDRMNVASVLKQNGYNTGFVGKFHVGYHQFLGNNSRWEAGGLETYPKDADPRVDAETNEKLKKNHQWWCKAIGKYGFDYVNGVYAANLRELFNDYLNVHNVEWTADAAVDFIKKQQKEDDPFFLYVATTYPHGPAPERKVDGKYTVSLDTDPSLTGEGVVVKDKALKEKRRIAIKEAIKPGDDRTSPTAQWWDDTVGKIIDQLKKCGQYENTLIVYTSDHGKMNHGKTTLYETGVHVPLIMHWPAKIKEARTYDHVVGSVDYTPTILDICSAKVPEAMKTDGVSLKSVLLGSDKPVREALLLKMGYATGVKTDDWKYIALRYPEDIENAIQKGEDFLGYRRERVAQPYYMLHKQLSQKAANGNPHYFERNQLYRYKMDVKEDENLYKMNKDVAQKMHRVLQQQLEEVIPDRPFGEFVGDHKSEFLHLQETIEFPAFTDEN
ncbi:hypothetical protein EYV94_02430 [Puteibacter caeruleilacunae]|nr:hypothetical protein EYV94_02430 [Puteibacter caeruleilacunae]